jgi:integrase
LRHTAATTLLLSGVDVRTVGHVLGHVDPSTTLRIYSHVMIDATKDAVKALGERLEWIVSRRS